MCVYAYAYTYSLHVAHCRSSDGRPAAERLLAWGADRVRPAPDPGLALDRRYSFGLDPLEERAEAGRRAAEERTQHARTLREASQVYIYIYIYIYLYIFIYTYFISLARSTR